MWIHGRAGAEALKEVSPHQFECWAADVVNAGALLDVRFYRAQEFGSLLPAPRV